MNIFSARFGKIYYQKSQQRHIRVNSYTNQYLVSLRQDFNYTNLSSDSTKKIKSTFLKYIQSVLCCLVFFLVNYNAYANRSPQEKISDDIIAKIDEFVRYNAINSKNRHFDRNNYIIYYSPDVEYTPTTPVTVSNWLHEDPLGMVAFVDEYRDWLNVYNHKIHGKYNTKIQHYVVVIDLYKSVNQVKMVEYKSWVSSGGVDGKFERMNLPENGITREEAFHSIVEDKIDEYVRKCKLSAIFDSEAKKYISLVYVDRAVSNNRVNTIIKVRGIHSSAGGVFNNVGIDGIGLNGFRAYVKDFPLHLREGLNLVGTRIRAFIEHFWEDDVDYPDFGNCMEAVTELNPNSAITQEFITDDRCEDVMDPTLGDIVLKSAEFLDWVAVNYDHLGSNFFNDDCLNPIKWREKLNTFFNDYKSETTPPYSFDSYAVWLKELHDGNDDIDRILRSYLEEYYTVGEYSFSRAKNILISDWLLTQCNNAVAGTIPASVQDIIDKGNPRYKFKLNEDFYADFYKIFSELNYGNFTVEQKQEIFDLIMSFNDTYNNCNETDIEEIFWKYYLNPFQLGWPIIGPSGHSMAKQVGDFIREQTMSAPGYVSPDIEEEDSFIVVDFSSEYAAAKGIYGDVEVVQDRSVEYNKEEDRLTFNMNVCEASSVWFFWGPFPYLECNGEFPFTQEKSDFWKLRYATTISHPGYFEDSECTNGGNPCTQNVELEPTFYTAYKIRENNAQETLNEIAIAIEILTLPLGGWGVATAKGAWRIAHGIWLANAVGSIYIGVVTPQQFTQDCIDLFGSSGEKIAQDIILINTIIAFSELGAGVASGTTKYLKKMNRADLEKAGAGSRFANEYRNDTGQDIDGLDHATHDMVGRQVIEDMKSRPGTGTNQVIEDVIESRRLEYYPLANASGSRAFLVKTHERLRKLINRNRAVANPEIINKLNDLDNVPSSTGNGTQLDDLISDINSNDDLFEFLTEIAETNQPNLASRLERWEELHIAGKLTAKFDINTLKFFGKIKNFSQLKTKLLNDFNDADIIDFSDKFFDTSDWGFSTLNSTNIGVVDFWKVNKTLLHGYHQKPFVNWPSSSLLPPGRHKDIVEFIENVPGGGNGIDNIHMPGNVNHGQIENQIDSKVVAVGMWNSNIPPTIKYNQKKAIDPDYGTQFIEDYDGAYLVAKDQLDPLLIDLLDYMDWVRKDKVGYSPAQNPSNFVFDGTTHQKLYAPTNSYDITSKLVTSQRPGIHAEILVANQMIAEMRAANLTINSLEDLVTNGGKIVVKGKNISSNLSTHVHMPTCPHCHNILKQVGLVIEEF